MTKWQNHYAKYYKLRPGEIHGNKVGSRKEVALRSMTEVAALMGLTRQRVQQLERSALLKLQLKLQHAYQEWLKEKSESSA